jgi:hypothetical protein
MPINIPIPGESAIASYNYTDISEGTGIVVFYGYTHKEDVTLSYALIQNTVYSNDCYTGGAATDAAFTKKYDLDFDVKFNMPKRMKGKLTATFTLDPTSDGGVGTVAAYAIIKARKWDGSAETEIANSQSATVTCTAAQANYFTLNTMVDISSIVNFKKGETLRITVEIWAKKVAGNGGTVYLLHDPKNRVDAVVMPPINAGGAPLTSQLIFYVPFVLDL